MYHCANENNIKKEWRQSHRYMLIKENICNFNKLTEIFNKYKPTHIIHFAAQSHVQHHSLIRYNIPKII